jgi:methylenetetrahydrofolate dehydrogenase (NADP+)/methenyltetrahydrofolate cyclohydrolase
VTARIIDGKARAERVTAEIKEAVAARVAAGKSPPGLAVVLVGEHPASQVYVRNKEKASNEAGLRGVVRPKPCAAAPAIRRERLCGPIGEE